MFDNMITKAETGRRGEDIAVDYLRQNGYLICATNWRQGRYEIDIVAQKAGMVHFVEVKTRMQSIQAPPQENVDRTKQRRITKAALGFLKTKKGLPYGNHECHFDIMAITFKGDTWTHEWFPQAYIPIYL